MFSWETVWFVVWITAIIFFTGAVLMLVTLGCWVGAQKLIEEIRWRKVLRQNRE